MARWRAAAKNPRHAANRMEEDFNKIMSIQLEAYKRHLKEHLYAAGRRTVKVLDVDREQK
jgi:hypothetical protein